MRIIRRQEGLSLAEVLVALAIIVVALAPMLGVTASSRASMEGASRRQEAAAAARTIMDSMMAREFVLIQSEGLVTPETYTDDPRYTYKVEVTERQLDDGSPYIKDIVVTVYWTEQERDLSVKIYSAVTMRKT